MEKGFFFCVWWVGGVDKNILGQLDLIVNMINATEFVYLQMAKRVNFTIIVRLPGMRMYLKSHLVLICISDFSHHRH